MFPLFFLRLLLKTDTFLVVSDTEPDSVPPPVPPKNRDSDYFGSIDGNSNRSSGESTDMGSVRDSQTPVESNYAPVYNFSYEKIALRVKPVPASDYVTNLSSIIAGKPVGPEFDSKKRAPTPPPKPSRSNKSTPTKDRDRDSENNYE